MSRVEGFVRAQRLKLKDEEDEDSIGNVEIVETARQRLEVGWIRLGTKPKPKRKSKVDGPSLKG